MSQNPFENIIQTLLNQNPELAAKFQPVQKKNKNKTKKEVGENDLRRATHPFMRWRSANKQLIQDTTAAEYPGLRGRELNKARGDVASRLWKALTPEEQAPFVQAYEAQKAEIKSKRGLESRAQSPTKQEEPDKTSPVELVSKPQPSALELEVQALRAQLAQLENK